MRRMAFAVLALVGWCAAPARAETLPLIEGLPASYTPGEDFTFTIRVPELTGVVGYTLELQFATQLADPPLNSPLIAFPTFPTNGTYPFGTPTTSVGFSADPNSPVVTLTISDPPDPTTLQRSPVNIVADVNDFLATITVSPAAGLTGPIVVSFTDNTVFLIQEGDEVRGFGSVEIPQATGGGNPVPAPPGALLLGIGGLLFGARGRFVRRAA